MKKPACLLGVLLLLSGTSVFGQINILAIDWTKFKGAKTIKVLSGKSEGNYTIVSLDKDSHVLSEVSFYKGKQCSSEDYNYDGQGRIQEHRRTSMMDTERPRVFMHTFSYAQNKSEELTVAEDGVMYEKKEAKLDANGRKVSEVCFNAEGRQGNTYEYSYDAAGNKIAVLLIRGKDEIAGAKWDDKMLTKKNVFRYDEHGNPVLYEVYNVLDNVTQSSSMSYVYDAHGNWTRRSDTWRDATGAVNRQGIALEITYY